MGGRSDFGGGVGEGGLLLRLNTERATEENYTRAAMHVVGEMALPNVYRLYFAQYVVDAFEFTVARMMLAEADPAAVAALYRHAFLPMVRNDPRVELYTDRFERIDRLGFFTRILWPEFDHFGRSSVGRRPTNRMRADSASLVRWLDLLASRRRGEPVRLNFRNGSFCVRVILIKDRRRQLPLDTYAYWIAVGLDEGCPRVYVCARDDKIPDAEALARRFADDPRVERVEKFRFPQFLQEESYVDQVFLGTASATPGEEPSPDAQLSEDELDSNPTAPLIEHAAVCVLIWARPGERRWREQREVVVASGKVREK